MSYTLPYINSTITSMQNDIALFNDNTKNQLEIVLKAKEDFEKQNESVSKNIDVDGVLNANKRKLTRLAKSVLSSVYSELKYEYSEEIKNDYFKSQIPSEIAKEPKNIVDFCSHFLGLREERKLDEVPDTKTKIEKLKEKADKIAKEEVDLKSKTGTEFNLSEQLNKVLQEQFEILKNDIKNESVENEKINFRLYFPSIKNKKTIRAKTIVDEMDFDIFVEFSKLPVELKINKIYLEWEKELKKLFFKKRISELQSLKQADEIILKKYPK